MNLVNDLKETLNAYNYARPPGDVQDVTKIANVEAYHESLKYVKNKGFALDIGAHVGTMTRRMAADFDKVVGFEPAFHKFTIHNTKDLDHVTIEPHGLGNEIKEEQMYIMTEKTGGSSIVRHPRRWDKWQKNAKQRAISITTLDEYSYTDINFIKIDVESYEYFVIDGARKTLAYNSPVIMIEYLNKYKHHTHPPSQTHDLLTELGYQEVMKIKDDHIYIPR